MIWVATRRPADPKQEDIQAHYINLPTPGQDGFYRQSVSFNAFKRRTQKRYIRAYITPGGEKGFVALPMSFTWRCEHISDYEFMRDHKLRLGALEPTVEIDHASIWDFYKAIGYDYKKDRFDEEPIKLNWPTLNWVKK